MLHLLENMTRVGYTLTGEQYEGIVTNRFPGYSIDTTYFVPLSSIASFCKEFAAYTGIVNFPLSRAFLSSI